MKLFRILVLLCCVAFFQASGESSRAGEQISVDDQLLDFETAAQAALTHQEDAVGKYADLVEQVNALMEESNEMLNLEKELVERTLALEVLIQQANAVQLQYMAWQLNETIEKEIQQRAPPEEESVGESVDLSNAVTLEELQEQMQPARLLEDSETKLEAWVESVMREEVTRYHTDAADHSSGKCVTPIEAAQLAQTSLMTYAHDGVSMVDHAHGAGIVHELTSDTYVPPADRNQLLGNAWWRKYIPEDWERVLPSDWEEWSARVPSFLSHSLVSSAC